MMKKKTGIIATSSHNRSIDSGWAWKAHQSLSSSIYWACAGHAETIAGEQTKAKRSPWPNPSRKEMR